MPAIRNYKCTQTQFDVFSKNQIEMHDIFKDLVHRGLQAKLAVVDARLGDGDGEVDHGANVIVNRIAHSYYEAAQALQKNFERKENYGSDYFPWMVLRSLIVSGKVVRWMEILIERNGGKIPEEWDEQNIPKED